MDSDNAMSSGSDGGSDIDSYGRWLTYPQLAEIRGIDKLSAIKLATRRKWRRRKNNSGHMQVCVPLDALPQRDKGMQAGSDNAIPMSRIISGFETAIVALTERAEAAERRADEAASHVPHITALADQALTILRDRVDKAEQRADRAEAATADANARVNEAELGVEVANERAAAAQALADRALAQLTDAVARADRSEAAITGERTRADVLRADLDSLRHDLDAAQRDARTAKEATQTALQAAATVRRADEARKARGLLGRLRAALRGE